MPGSSQHSRGEKTTTTNVKVVDLFCGVGGLTHGLVLEGLDVVAGVDNDEACRSAFEKNNRSRFIHKDIAKFRTRELLDLFGDADVRVLVGCAPCQPFSSLGRRATQGSDARKRWYPLYRFMNLIRSTDPHVVSMENVPELSDTSKYPVFGEFVRLLERRGYHVAFEKVDASRYGVPQRRRRLVLLASRLGAIELVSATHDADRLVTVRQTIGDLPPIEDGESHEADALHRSSKLSPLNRRRIAATPHDGGGAKDWPKRLRPNCYRRDSGRSFMSTVYGRMKWDAPSPTMTTQCTTLGTGRFGHPDQNRAISLREAALLQSFPKHYDFGEVRHSGTAAKLIGNAVPVLLGRAIGRSILNHIEEHGASIRSIDRGSGVRRAPTRSARTQSTTSKARSSR